MQYMIMTYEDQAAFDARTDAQASQSYWGSWAAYTQTLKESGVMVGGSGLQPPHAGTTVRFRDGQRHIQDGPYAETKEQLGGYFLIEVSDLDTALDWAVRCPAAAAGVVEVRPVLVMQS
ncbi:MAG: YciI family protein [Gemmatimonadaceae bacterium]|nr:YciI family protein [Gloeobacterales cyanobacterium ES-bin-141]